METRRVLFAELTIMTKLNQISQLLLSFRSLTLSLIAIHGCTKIHIPTPSSTHIPYLVTLEPLSTTDRASFEPVIRRGLYIFANGIYHTHLFLTVYTKWQTNAHISSKNSLHHSHPHYTLARLSLLQPLSFSFILLPSTSLYTHNKYMYTHTHE